MEEKRDLYIDVDGVFFAVYDGFLQLRPGATSFLRFCIRYFNCFWLTAWDEERLVTFFALGYAGSAIGPITHIPWREKGNNKALSINFDRPFLWIEDGILDEERQILVDHKAWENFIHVNDKGKDELYRLIGVLGLRIGLTPEQLMRE